MAIEFNLRTKLLAGVVAIALAGAGAWFFYFQDEAPPPRVAAPAKPAVAAPKPPEVAATPAAEAAKPITAASPSLAPIDDLAALDRAIKASESRASDLEKTVADLKKLVETKSKQIAELEKKEAATSAASMAKPEAPKPAVKASK